MNEFKYSKMILLHYLMEHTYIISLLKLIIFFYAIFTLHKVVLMCTNLM